MLKELVVFCAVVSFVTAAQTRAKPSVKPEKFKDVAGCYINLLDDVIPFGEVRATIEPCVEFSCSERWVLTSTCPVIVSGGTSPDDEKPVGVVFDKPYPDCCTPSKYE